jgi:phosphate transport system protein
VSDVSEPGGGAASEDATGALDRRVARVFALVSEALVAATTALLDQDAELGEAVVVRDRAIDELTSQIGQSMWEVITAAPDAAARRQAVLILLMLPELERSGDLAEHIAQRALTDLGGEMTAVSRGLVQRMSDVASAMWDMARIAFVERTAQGTALDEADEELDVLHESLSGEVASGHMTPSVAVQVALMSRFYERLGDHAVNLARRIEDLTAGCERNGIAW